MRYRRLFILVEGDDDEQFFQRIINPKFEEKYNSVTLWKYAQEKYKRIDGLLSSVRAMGADYIYVADINRSPCVTYRKRKIETKFRNIDKERILVIIKEIEGWYLAGLDTASSTNLKISAYDTTDNITKEDFNGLIPKRFDSRIDFILEVLKFFSIETARQKNRSFSYFIGKYVCKA